jgi:hypothetical protein
MFLLLLLLLTRTCQGVILVESPNGVIEPVIKPMAYSKASPPNTACRFGAGFRYSAMQRVQKSILTTSV